jgi:hypothetical protein
VGHSLRALRHVVLRGIGLLLTRRGNASRRTVEKIVPPTKPRAPKTPAFTRATLMRPLGGPSVLPSPRLPGLRPTTSGRHRARAAEFRAVGMPLIPGENVSDLGGGLSGFLRFLGLG